MFLRQLSEDEKEVMSSIAGGRGLGEEQEVRKQQHTWVMIDLKKQKAFCWKCGTEIIVHVDSTEEPPAPPLPPTCSSSSSYLLLLLHLLLLLSTTPGRVPNG